MIRSRCMFLVGLFLNKVLIDSVCVFTQISTECKPSPFLRSYRGWCAAFKRIPPGTDTIHVFWIYSKSLLTHTHVQACARSHAVCYNFCELEVNKQWYAANSTSVITLCSKKSCTCVSLIRLWPCVVQWKNRIRSMFLKWRKKYLYVFQGQWRNLFILSLQSLLVHLDVALSLQNDCLDHNTHDNSRFFSLILFANMQFHT